MIKTVQKEVRKMNFNNSKKKKIFAAAIVIVLVASMVLSVFVSAVA